MGEAGGERGRKMGKRKELGLCKNVEAFEMQCYRRAMGISYVEHVTNEEVLQRVGQDRDLLG